MRLEHHIVGGYVRYISPHIIILLIWGVILDSQVTEISEILQKYLHKKANTHNKINKLKKFFP